MHAAVALNTIMRRWGKEASSEWNVSGDLCSGFAADKNDWDYYPNINPFIKCDCTFSNNTLCRITKLYAHSLWATPNSSSTFFYRYYLSVVMKEGK